MFIRDLNCTSPQHTLSPSFFEEDLVLHCGNQYLCIEPVYSGLIPPAQLRRMGRASKLGAGTALPLLNKYPEISAIVLATADGGVEDSMQFLNQLVDYKEGTLTPTHFVQSTPNSIAGLLALLAGKTGYNATHVNKGLAFESALLDAMLVLKENEASTLLLGAVEQFSIHNYNIESLAGSFKKNESNSLHLLHSNTPGTVNGEGCAMFVAQDSGEGAMCAVQDVAQISYPTKEELYSLLLAFLHKNKLQPSDIDTLVLGFNGDNRIDHWYTDMLQDIFPNPGVYTFKNFCGEYPTASAFAMWLGVNLLSGKSLPPECCYRASGVQANTLLIYNQYKGEQHGFILLKKTI
jgi:hypothetical protein